MPITLPPLSRRRFIGQSLVAGAALLLRPRGFAAAATTKVDPHTWALLSDPHIAADRGKIARTEGERQKEAARAEIEQEVNRAKERLRAQVAALALTGAEKILQSSIDRNRHSELLDKLAAEL